MFRGCPFVAHYRRRKNGYGIAISGGIRLNRIPTKRTWARMLEKILWSDRRLRPRSPDKQRQAALLVWKEDASSCIMAL